LIIVDNTFELIISLDDKSMLLWLLSYNDYDNF
jgi:hypothetical protein